MSLLGPLREMRYTGESKVTAPIVNAMNALLGLIVNALLTILCVWNHYGN